MGIHNKIPWLFPDFLISRDFPWLFTEFPDFSLTLKNKNFPWLFPDRWQPWTLYKAVIIDCKKFLWALAKMLLMSYYLLPRVYVCIIVLGEIKLFFQNVLKASDFHILFICVCFIPTCQINLPMLLVCLQVALILKLQIAKNSSPTETMTCWSCLVTKGTRASGVMVYVLTLHRIFFTFPVDCMAIVFKD